MRALLLISLLLLAVLSSAVQAQTSDPSSTASSGNSTGTAKPKEPEGDSDAAVALTVLLFVGVCLGIALHVNAVWIQPILRAYRVKGTAGAWAEFIRVPGAPPVAEV